MDSLVFKVCMHIASGDYVSIIARMLGNWVLVSHGSIMVIGVEVCVGHCPTSNDCRKQCKCNHVRTVWLTLSYNYALQWTRKSGPRRQTLESLRSYQPSKQVSRWTETHVEQQNLEIVH